MEIKKLVVGNATEILIRTIFDSRIAEESSSENLNAISRAVRIRDLMNQTLGFVKRNPNSKFTIISPELLVDKKVKLSFTNFVEDEEDDDSEYQINITDDFTTAEIIKFVEIGNNIKLTLKAE